MNITAQFFSLSWKFFPNYSFQDDILDVLA